MYFKKIIKNTLSRLIKSINNSEIELLAIGSMLSKQQSMLNFNDLNQYEFKIFSQFGDDGIIQYLVSNLKIENHTFIEFGVEDYHESNTRFLLMNNNWSGIIFDSSNKNIDSIKKNNWYWKYDLECKSAFITKSNVNDLLLSPKWKNLGLLNIDIDGNDYHILESIDLDYLNPSIIIIEYNSIFGYDRPISIPYYENFNRTKAHYSNLYFGSSLNALNYLANSKGYKLVGCNHAGNNAYFVSSNLLNEKIKEKSIKEAFKPSKFRESINYKGELTFLNSIHRKEAIKGMEVYNVISKKNELY